MARFLGSRQTPEVASGRRSHPREPGGQRLVLSEQALHTSPAVKAKFRNQDFPAAEIQALVLSHAVHPSGAQGSDFRQLKERWLNHKKTHRDSLASRGEFNPVMRLDLTDLLCGEVLLKYERDRDRF